MDFLKQKGSFRNLKAYRKAECIYDITYIFTHRYLSKGDRTVDQMVQAARSGKQNIAEGRAAGNTSAETEIKLMNVAKASLQELLVDYEDYLRVRNLELWGTDHPRYPQLRAFCLSHCDTNDYSVLSGKLNDCELANLAVCLIHQTDAMLYKLIELVKGDFMRNGGTKEAMYRARIQARNNPGKKKEEPER